MIGSIKNDLVRRTLLILLVLYTTILIVCGWLIQFAINLFESVCKISEQTFEFIQDMKPLFVSRWRRALP